MLEVYSLNVSAGAGAAFPLTSLTLQKGASAELLGNGTIKFNKCGVYMIACNCSAVAASTIQLAKNGILQPQAQATGTSPAFVTLVQVSEAGQCCCSTPTMITIVNPTDASETATVLHVVVTKVC